MSTSNQLRVMAALPIVIGWGAQTVGKAPLKNAVLATSVAFAALHYFTETNFRVFGMAQKFRGVHTLARVATVTWTSGYLLLELSKRVSFLPISALTVVYSPRTSVVASWVGMIGGFYLAGKVIEYINILQLRNQGMQRLDELAKDDEKLKNALKDVKVELQRGNDELMDQWLLVLEIVMDAALMVFSDAKFSFAAQLVANLYTLKQITQRSWLLLSRSFWQESHNEMIKFEYQPIFFRDYSKPKDECSICLDVPEKRYYFCDNHSYDQVCLTALFIKEMAKFRVVNKMTRVSHTEYGKEERATYNVYAREDEKPKCPECRGIPSQNRLYVRVYDLKREEYCWGDVTWLNYQPEQKIQVKLTDSSAVDGVSYVRGTLQDGSSVFLQGDASMVGKIQEVKIVNVWVKKGFISLQCQSEEYDNKKLLRLQGLVALDPAQQHLLSEYNRVKEVINSENWRIEDLVGNDCWVMDGEQYDDVASAPAVVERLDDIAKLIDPKILKPLVAEQFHLEISSTYLDLMNEKNHWQHPGEWY